MDASALKELQAPFKQRYRDEPAAAVITLKAEGALGEGVSCKVDTGRALIEAGLHPATGGTGLQACSGDMLLEALVACAGVTLRAVATALAIPLRAGRVLAEGDLDFRGTLGVAKDAPVGFKSIRLRFELDTDASEDQLATLQKLTERYCVCLPDLVPAAPGERRLHELSTPAISCSRWERREPWMLAMASIQRTPSDPGILTDLHRHDPFVAVP